MKLRQDYRGYKVVDLSRHGKSIIMRVNRLVALAFLPNPSHLPEVNHRDAVKGNNSVGNLEWVSHEQNMNHAKQMQLMRPRRGEDSGNAKFTNLRATKARNRFIPGISDAAAEARREGVATESFKRIIRGETFADLPFVALVVGDFALPLAIFPQRVRGLLRSALPSNVSQKNPVGVVTRTAGEVRASMLQFKHKRPLRR